MYTGNNGRRQFRMVPYVTCYRPRKIGNVPAQYVIRSPASSVNQEPEEEDVKVIPTHNITAPSPPSSHLTFADGQEDSPPTLLPFGEGDDYEDGDETVDPKVEVADDEFPVEEEHPTCSYYMEEAVTADHDYSALEEREQLPAITTSTRTPKERPDPRYTYPMCYVDSSRVWSYKNELQYEDGFSLYVPDPFKPAPPMRGAPPAVIRMHYAARRVDSMKYKAQQSLADEAKQNNMDNAVCINCNLRFFLPANHLRSHIRHDDFPGRYESMAVAYFKCPMCHYENRVEDVDKEII